MLYANIKNTDVFAKKIFFLKETAAFHELIVLFSLQVYEFTSFFLEFRV